MRCPTSVPGGEVGQQAAGCVVQDAACMVQCLLTVPLEGKQCNSAACVRGAWAAQYAVLG